MVLSNIRIKELEANSIELTAQYVFDLLSEGRRERRTYHLAPTLGEVEHAFPDSRSILNSRNKYDKSHLSFIPPLGKDQIGIASLDLRIGRLIAESDTIIQGVTKKDMLKMKHWILEENQPFTFNYDPEGGKVYYVSSFECIFPSTDLELHVDSKSTTGRLGTMTHGAGIDQERELITIIQPFSFPIKITIGKTRLYQMAIRFKNTPYMTNEEILKSDEIKVLKTKSIKNSLNSRGLLLRFNPSFAYKAKKCDIPIDMDNPNNNQWENYFEIVEGNSQLRLDKKTLYLLGSLEELCLGGVSGFLSREEEVMTGTGAWGHFAGIIQPYFVGGITLEYFSYNNRILKKGDSAGVIRFDQLVGEIKDPEKYKGSYHK